MKTILIAEESQQNLLRNFAQKMKGLGSVEFVFLRKEKNQEKTKSKDSYFFSQKDLNLFGGLKNDVLKNVLAQKRDLMIVYGEVSKAFHKVLLQIPVQKRMGMNSDANLNFHVKLRTNHQEVQQMTNFANEILEKIKR
ncbi:MAG: hypothetical protein N4A41_10180 [Crocinitomicaceae bacterium]|jgi:hypothetical protein|nr:hypothetical protein [Crocinitomicaceae bacterium]